MRIAFATALLLSAGCHDTGRAPPARAPVSGIQISDEPGNYEKGNVFKLLDTASLYVRVVVPEMPQLTTLHLSFVDPSGQPFYEAHVPYTTSSQPTMAEGGLMHMPMQAWPANKLDGGWELVRSVPIRGSNFTRVPRSEGAWGITATVEGVPGELHASVIFQP
jgi:hypothetical protein